MKFWIAKNSEVPVREQLVTQVTIAIASGDVAIGDRLPSTGEIARRFEIHSNTVSSAYRRLVEQGVLEFRTGKGYFAAARADESRPCLDAIVADAVRRAGELGYGAEDIIRALGGKSISAPRGVLLIESDPGLRDIILYELRPRLNVSIDAVSFEEFAEAPDIDSVQLAAMTDEKHKIDPLLANGRTCVYLKGRSAADAMKGHRRPAKNETIAVASGWNDFLTFARVMLLAARIEPGNLVVRSTNDNGWLGAVAHAEMIICDPLTAASLDASMEKRIFNIISDESIAELSRSTATSS